MVFFLTGKFVLVNDYRNRQGRICACCIAPESLVKIFLVKFVFARDYDVLYCLSCGIAKDRFKDFGSWFLLLDLPPK